MKKNDTPALLLIDIQQGFDDHAHWGGHRNNPDAELNAGKLLHYWRARGLPVFHVQHCSTDPASRLAEGRAGHAFKAVVQPQEGEPIIRKHVNSAFIGTTLQQQLDQARLTSIVIVGLTTDHCVSTTTRMAANYGYKAFVVSDATATFDKVGPDGQAYSAELLHATALASLHQEFANVLTTEALLAHLMED